jgi:hypothetical protein
MKDLKESAGGLIVVVLMVLAVLFGGASTGQCRYDQNGNVHGSECVE